MLGFAFRRWVSTPRSSKAEPRIDNGDGGSETTTDGGNIFSAELLVNDSV
jgi:hypothetical protein